MGSYIYTQNLNLVFHVTIVYTTLLYEIEKRVAF